MIFLQKYRKLCSSKHTNRSFFKNTENDFPSKIHKTVLAFKTPKRFSFKNRRTDFLSENKDNNFPSRIPYYTLVKYLTRVKRVRHLINANVKILHISPALNDLKIINAALINARRAIRVNNMTSYFCVIRYILYMFVNQVKVTF